MIVADTGAILALIDTSDRHHDDVLGLYDDDPAQWILPWTFLPEVDYLVGAHIGEKAQRAWLEDLATGAFQIEWGVDADVKRAHTSCAVAIVRSASDWWTRLSCRQPNNSEQQRSPLST